MKMTVYVAAAGVAACTFLAGCDKLIPKPPAEKQPASISLTSSGGSTYLLNNENRKIFALRNGEFVEMPVVDASSLSGKNGMRNFTNEAKDLMIYTRLKFIDGKLQYIINVSPKLTPEYLAYLVKSLEAAKSKAVAPVAPDSKFVNANWLEEVDKSGNTVNVELDDEDGFRVQRLMIELSGSLGVMRTGILDDDNKTRVSVKFEGSVDISGADFARIKSSTATYSIN